MRIQAVVVLLGLARLTLTLQFHSHETYKAGSKRISEALTVQENEGMCSCYRTDKHGTYKPFFDMPLQFIKDQGWGSKCTEASQGYKKAYSDRVKHPNFAKKLLVCWDSIYFKRRAKQFEMNWLTCDGCQLKVHWQSMLPLISAFPPTTQEYVLAVAFFIREQEGCVYQVDDCATSENYPTLWKKHLDKRATVYCGLKGLEYEKWCIPK